ncbi:enoyl-(Acyl carrier protein) reductase domain-containing protein [Phthorimaea operculella]|nr:enoyl-(Acyl carrier protein) reductase domain-containing protein [Phthorimaea operculella]
MKPATWLHDDVTLQVHRQFPGDALRRAAPLRPRRASSQEQLAMEPATWLHDDVTLQVHQQLPGDALCRAAQLFANFSNKVVIITGASSGIGAALAVKFAKLHAKLSLIGRNKANLKKIAAKCEIVNGFKPLCVIADISKDEDVENIVKETVKNYGRIDVLINNAGVSKLTNIETEISDFDSIMATNVRGTYLLTKMAIPHLIETKGNVVNISSILSSKPVPYLTPYCMSKAALDMFTKCLALEVASRGVRVNSVNPGPVKTEIFKTAGMNDQQTELLFKSLEASAPLKKITSADDVAELVTYVASEKGSCLTGVNYIIDCGSIIGDAAAVDTCKP